MWPKVFNRGGPQAGQRLADIAYGSLHFASPDRFTAGGEATGAVAMSEDLEDRRRQLSFLGQRTDRGRIHV